MHAMGSAPEQSQRVARLLLEFGLAEHAPPDRDHSIGGEHEGFLVILVAADHPRGGLGLGAGQPLDDVARDLPLVHSLINGGGPQCIGHDARLLKQREPPRRGGGKHELGPEGAGSCPCAPVAGSLRRRRPRRSGLGPRVLGLGGTGPPKHELAT